MIKFKIDLDLNELNIEVKNDTYGNFVTAKRVYAEGVHNLSVAHLTLFKPLPINIPKGTPLMGVNDLNEVILGKIYGRSGYAGDRKIMFLYNKTSTLKCLVGNHPIENQETSGCLARYSNLQIMLEQPRNFSYVYDPYIDNDNGYTLKSLSINTARLMNDCKRCPYDDYLKFRKYYGSLSYADDWIEAAFEGRTTNFANGNANFHLYSDLGRGEAIHKSIAFMSIWMSIIGKMEGAIDLCAGIMVKNCTNNCNPQAVQLWDDAVALYTGSLEGTEGKGSGLLPYSLASKRCKQFNTCEYIPLSEESQQKYSINDEIIRFFRQGQNAIVSSSCEAVRRYKESIVRLMTVPIIQSTLRYAYINQYHFHRMKKREQAQAQAEGALFAASVLPFIHFCGNVRSQADAQLIFQNLKVGSLQTDFAIVKTAFERNYDCLGLNCYIVGGLYNNSSHKYLANALPCINPTEQDIRDIKITFIIFFGLTGPIIVVTCCLLPCRRRKHGEEIPQEDKIIDRENSDDESDDDVDVLSMIDIRGIL